MQHESCRMMLIPKIISISHKSFYSKPFTLTFLWVSRILDVILNIWVICYDVSFTEFVDSTYCTFIIKLYLIKTYLRKRYDGEEYRSQGILGQNFWLKTKSIDRGRPILIPISNNWTSTIWQARIISKALK